MAQPEESFHIVMAGVVPPPLHGQSIVTARLFEADFSPIRKFIVPIRSSSRIDQVGRFSVSKVLGLFPIIVGILKARERSKAKVLYYTAGSGAWVPFLRDFCILTICRPWFKLTLIHYHSGNLSDFLASSSLLSSLGRWTYGRSAWSIRLGKGCPVPMYDGEPFVRELVNGLDFPTQEYQRLPSTSFRILFLGNLFVEKGVVDLIQAVRILASRTADKIILTLIGGWPDEDTRETVTHELADLPNHVEVSEPRLLSGESKDRAYFEHDIFVFPTYYNRENLPLVVIEAMAAGLPVIATKWRGNANLVVDGETGILVEPRNIDQLADAVLQLKNDRTKREAMGRAGKVRYEKHFTSDKFLSNARSLFLEALRAV